MKELTWVEVSKDALANNIKQFRKIVGDDVIICPCVKSNAYGHGLVNCAKTFLDSGANWLAVNSVYEARALRDAGIDSPIYILGYVGLDSLQEAVLLNCRIVLYNTESAKKLGEIGKNVKVHLKIETGNNRQGLLVDELVDFVKYISEFDNIEIEGASTHFANIEDTTDHSYAKSQLDIFIKTCEKVESETDVKFKIKHCANSAATILFPETHFDMVRLGIAIYGMWPSNETYVSYSKEAEDGFILKPALCWKTKIAQIKTLAADEFVGYGCTYRTTRETRLAILPIGYYDGYDRGVNGGHVLIHGKRAPIRGRICMNIMMVDVTDIPESNLEDEVVLIGKDGSEEISAEKFASFAGTINYEVTTRINERIPRILV